MPSLKFNWFKFNIHTPVFQLATFLSTFTVLFILSVKYCITNILNSRCGLQSRFALAEICAIYVLLLKNFAS